MMKKNGFTLAEVLITLAIIGVVATMTLPALLTNTQEQQSKTGLRKAINTLTEAGVMHKTVDGFAYDGFGGDQPSDIKSDEADDTVSMEALLRARTAIDFTKTGNSNFDPIPKSGVGANSVVGTKYVHFKDGMILIYDSNKVLADDTNSVAQDDGLALGYVVAIDTNGPKQPNQLSNCEGAVNGADETQDAVDYTGDLSEVCKKSKRQIKDQFLLRLRGTTVQPEGPAAIWAFNN